MIGEIRMINEKFLEVIAHEGVVAIVTWTKDNVHVANTWNRYITVVSDDTFLIPAAWMKKTEENIKVNDQVKITLGSKEVMGSIGMGAGFSIEGTASFLDSGSEYDMMKEKFPFLSQVLKIKINSLKQTI